MLLFIVMTTWFRGRELVTAERFQIEGPLRDFVKKLRGRKPPVTRVPGTGCS